MFLYLNSNIISKIVHILRHTYNVLNKGVHLSCSVSMPLFFFYKIIGVILFREITSEKLISHS